MEYCYHNSKNHCIIWMRDMVNICGDGCTKSYKVSRRDQINSEKIKEMMEATETIAKGIQKRHGHGMAK